MQSFLKLKKYREFFSQYLSTNTRDRCFILLFFFLLVVLLTGYIIPQLNFGRFYGTDGYTHLFHTDVMVSSKGLAEFYEKAGTQVSDPSSDTNAYNYPFGLWLFGATIAKITGMPPISAEFLYVILFLLILLGSFYLYSGLMLEKKEQKILACLFLLSMPYTVTTLLSYRSGIFALPFMFIILYIAINEPIQWKLFPIAWMLIFILVISHTGTFVFLMGFSIAFFFLYCFIWGKFLQPLFVSISSSLIIYIISLRWFPEILSQYEYIFSNFLEPGDFMATKFNFSLPGDLVRVFYTNLLVNLNFIYLVIFCASLFTIGYFLIYIHKKTATFFFKNDTFYAFTLPIQNISHSFVTTPIWVGPVHSILSIVGIFHLDGKGKCILITTLLAGLLPDLLKTFQGDVASTGALREIWYLVIIIPITATLGFWHIIVYMNGATFKNKKIISNALIIVVFVSMIVIPIVGITYYLPTISGEDYVIGGLKWLGDNGDHYEKVAGYSLRPVPIYTNMTDVTYDLPSPTDRILINLLRNIFFIQGNQINNVHELRQSFGVKYIISTDRILDNLGKRQENLTIDSNSALSKIYSSNDFGIYEVKSSSENRISISYLADNISLNKRGGNYEIDSGYYKVILSDNNPIFKRFGTPKENFLGNGYFDEKIKISGTELSSDGIVFSLGDIVFTSEIVDNQITYKTVLKNPQNHNDVGTLLIQYTFYPNVIKREYRLSNDFLITKYSPQIDIQYSINIYSPMSQFVIKNDETRLEKEIVAFQETVTKNIKIEDFYLNDGQNGMYISFPAQSPQPSSVSYSGSTRYNKSGVGIIQSNSLKPGASFLSTQFLSLGSEDTAENHIQYLKEIKLINFPDGITPILITGYRTPQSDKIINEKITSGYAVLNNNSIPYTEAINPSIRIENARDLRNATVLRVLSINLQELLINNITIIGSQKTRATYFDDYNTQEANILLLNDYSIKQSVSFAGFMPDSFVYNLDTLTILSKNKIPLVFSNQVNPSIKGFGFPQIAYINSEPTGLVLLPVSTPPSSSLASQTRKEDVFLIWKTTIDSAANNDEMVIFSFRSQDIGDPAYTENFTELFSYVREKGLKFSSPPIISDYFKQIQKIRYSGFINGDIASLQVNNTNNVAIGNLTFKVTLPKLENGNYHTNYGDIIRMKDNNDKSVIYIRIEIPADSTKNIIIEPDMPRKSFHIEIPQQPIIEGTNTITVMDELENPLSNVDVIVDSTYYKTDNKGAVQFELERGYHTITVQSPGYNKYSSVFNVRGRIFIIEQVIGKYFDR